MGEVGKGRGNLKRCLLFVLWFFIVFHILCLISHTCCLENESYKLFSLCLAQMADLSSVNGELATREKELCTHIYFNVLRITFLN